ncbi:MAG: tRNA (cytidine(34)-2'-O)-methyltransferase [Clostridia bacterium]|nr:tRNA (cytidine(34)-2'-O)-methyltransferase [Clostridia bacterium]MBR3681477.1 tRNA (cytidine(34)-2'-O)-methyltransferase [Clostridia bacterium]
MKPLNIVLLNPEIPQNTGNISRTCAVTGAALHIIRPTGFEISDRTLKRAGLDYWDKLEVTYYDSFSEFLEKNPDGEKYYFSSHAERRFTEVKFSAPTYLVFGRESVGLPREIVENAGEFALRIPMLPTLRCLNLSNSVAVAAYEVLRQSDFPNMQ